METIKICATLGEDAPVCGHEIIQRIEAGLIREYLPGAGTGGSDLNLSILRRVEEIGRPINTRTREYLVSDKTEGAGDLFVQAGGVCVSARGFLAANVFHEFTPSATPLKQWKLRQKSITLSTILWDELEAVRSLSGESRSALIRRLISPSCGVETIADGRVHAGVINYHWALIRIRGNLTTLATIDTETEGFAELQILTNKASKEVKKWLGR